MNDPAADQLAAELYQRLLPLHRLPMTEAGVVRFHTGKIMQSLRSTNRERAAQAYRDVMAALWGNDRPERTNPDWWRTPLGLEMARVGAHAASGSMTHQEAANILRITRTGVGAYATRGTLARSPAGGVLISAVLARLSAQQEKQPA